MLFAVTSYLAVTVVLLARLAFSLWRVRRIVRRSEPILDPDFRSLCHDVWLESLAMVRPRFRLSRDINIPLAAGVDEPVILLPLTWQQWPHEKLHAVLVHEMAHVRRGDPDTALLSAIAVCLFWFHPLAYWLRRQLSASAEEACDEVVLDVVKPERYSQILIEFAAIVSSKRGLLAVSSVVAHKSLLVKRLERMFAPRPVSRLNVKLGQALALVLLCPALYLMASAQFQGLQPTIDHLSVGDDAQAAQVEAKLRQNPEDLESRYELMSFYFNMRNEAALTNHLLWAVEHHPELPMAMMSPPLERISPDTQEQLRGAWETALAKHPDSAGVVYHAGIFFVHDSPMRALALYKQAQSLPQPDPYTPKNILRSIAIVYVAAVVEEMPSSHGGPRRVDGINIDPADAAQLRNDLALSQDPALLSEVGTALTQLNFSTKGVPLIQQAIALDPTNPAWKEALESAQAEPVRQRNARIMEQVAQALAARETATGPILRVGPKVQAANLLNHADPVYPPLAVQARVQGSVEFTVVISADGKMQNIQLVRGHPLLVNAAKDAVAQYIYKPTLVNGNPVVVSTSVTVDFRLDQ